MDINTVAGDLLAFTAKHGWKQAALEITSRYLAEEEGGILEPVLCQRSLERNTLRLSRIFNGYHGPRYRKKAVALMRHVAAALVVLKRRQNGAGELVASALKECDEAHRAALVNAPTDELEREVREAIDSLLAYLPDHQASVQIIRV